MYRLSKTNRETGEYTQLDFGSLENAKAVLQTWINNSIRKHEPNSYQLNKL